MPEQNAAFFQRLVEHVQDIITVVDSVGTIIFESGAIEEVLGYGAGGRVGRNAFEFVHPDDLEVVNETFSKGVHDPGRTAVVEYRARRNDGTYARLESRAKNLLFDEAVGGVVVTSRDITARAEALDQLRLREERHRALLAALPDAMVRLNEHGDYLDIHVPHEYGTVMQPDSLIGLNTRDVLPAPVAMRAMAAIEQALETDEMQVFEYSLDVNGEQRIREARVVVAGDREVISIQRDVTEQRLAQQEVRRLKAFYEQVLEDIPADVAVMDPDGRIIYLNKRSVSDEELRKWLIGRTGVEYCEHRGLDPTIAHRRQRHIEEAVRTRSIVTFEEALPTSRGLKHILRMASPVIDEEGRVVQVIGYGLDITERKRAEDDLRQSREQLRQLALELQSIREEERTRIAREVHDVLGQALTALRMDVAWIERHSKPPGAEIQSRYDTMKSTIDDTIHAVRRISSELRPGVLDDLGLAAAIEWQSGAFQRRTGIACNVSVDAFSHAANNDRATAIFRIFQEILTNVARHAEAETVNIELRSTDEQIELVVTDDGRGASPDDVSGKKSLGVLGMRERAAAFGGSVSFSGRAGEGTAVHVVLPLSGDEA